MCTKKKHESHRGLSRKVKHNFGFLDVQPAGGGRKRTRHAPHNLPLGKKLTFQVVGVGAELNACGKHEETMFGSLLKWGKGCVFMCVFIEVTRGERGMTNCYALYTALAMILCSLFVLFLWE